LSKNPDKQDKFIFPLLFCDIVSENENESQTERRSFALHFSENSINTSVKMYAGCNRRLQNNCIFRWVISVKMIKNRKLNTLNKLINYYFLKKSDEALDAYHKDPSGFTGKPKTSHYCKRDFHSFTIANQEYRIYSREDGN
jgi:hypothetical protein